MISRRRLFLLVVTGLGLAGGSCTGPTDPRGNVALDRVSQREAYYRDAERIRLQDTGFLRSGMRPLTPRDLKGMARPPMN